MLPVKRGQGSVGKARATLFGQHPWEVLDYGMEITLGPSLAERRGARPGRVETRQCVPKHLGAASLVARDLYGPAPGLA